jgi:integrase
LGEVAARGKPGTSNRKVTLARLKELVRNDYVVNGKRSLKRPIQAFENHLEPYFTTERRAMEITSADVKAYIEHRQAEGAKSATINLELAALKRGFNLAIECEELSTRPVIRLLSLNNARQGFFERSDLDRLLEHLPDNLKVVIQTAYITGWRVHSELLSRRKADVDLNSGWLLLDPSHSKNAEGRRFPLLPELRQVLETQLDRVKRIEIATGTIIPWLFIYDNGRPIKDFRAAWATACERAGVPRAIPHDFRRTAVRNLIRAGVAQSVAMELTGHKTPAIFKRYAITDELMLNEAAAKLAAFHDAERRKSLPQTVVPLNRETGTL